MSEAQTTHMESMQFARQAVRFIGEGNTDEARELLSGGTGSQDWYPAGFQIFGDFYVHEGDNVQAMEMYERALALDPQNPRLLLSMGKLMLEEQPERAQDLFWRALRYEPGVPEIEAALKEAITRMEGPDSDDIPAEEPILEDEDALAALTEQLEPESTESESFDILDEEPTAELETIDILDEDNEGFDVADGDEESAAADDVQYSRTDDDLDLSEMTKAALADLDQPAAPEQIPEDAEALADIAAFTGEQAEDATQDTAGEATYELDSEDSATSEPEETPIFEDEGAEDLSMLAADFDLVESGAEPVVEDISEPEDDEQLPAEDITSVEESVTAEPEGPITAPATIDDMIPEQSTPGEADTDTAVDDIVTGFEEDDSDLSFLVGGDQQVDAEEEPAETDTEEELSVPDEKLAAPVLEEEPEDILELVPEDVMDQAQSAVEEEPVSTPEPEPETPAELKPTDSIEIGPDALFGESIDIGPMEIPKDFFDDEPETLVEAEPDTASSAPTGEMPVIEQEAPPEDAIELVAEPEQPPLDEEVAAAGEELAAPEWEKPVADIETAPIEPDMLSTEDSAPEQTESTASTDYSALLAGMDLSGIAEEDTGMTGGILELGEDDLSGLTFDESTPESIEEPVISDEERTELSALEKLMKQDEESPAGTDADMSFDATVHEDQMDVEQTDSTEDTGIDYSDILSGITASEDISDEPAPVIDIPSAEMQTEPPDTPAEDALTIETSATDEGLGGGYEDMLVQLTEEDAEQVPDEDRDAGDVDIIARAMPDIMTDESAEIVTEADTSALEPEPEPEEPEPVDSTSFADASDTMDEQTDESREDGGTVEDLMKGTMSIRLDLSGEDAAGVDNSSLDSLISDYMSALDSYGGEKQPVEPVSETVQPEVGEPVDEPEQAGEGQHGRKQDSDTGKRPGPGMDDISVEEFGADTDEPVSPEDATATMAEIFARQGLLSRAIDIYSSILTRDPDDEKARTRLDELIRLHDDASEDR